MLLSLLLKLGLVSPVLSGAGGNLQFMISVDEMPAVTLCDGGAGDGNVMTTGILDFDTSIGGVLTLNGRLRESVNTGTKRLVISANPVDASARPARFRNVTGDPHTIRITLISRNFGPTELDKLRVRFDGCVSDGVSPDSLPVIVMNHSVLGYLDPSDLATNSLRLTVSQVNAPSGTHCLSPPAIESETARLRTGVLSGQWEFTLGPNDQIEFTSTIEISSQQVRATGSLTLVMSERRRGSGIGELPFESVTIFDNGDGDNSLAVGTIDFGTVVGEGFNASGILTQGVGSGPKSLTLSSGTFENISSVERVFDFKAFSSTFTPACFGEQTLSIQGSTEDALGGAIRITAHGAATTEPLSTTISVADITSAMPFSPPPASTSALAVGETADVHWTFTAQTRDRIRITSLGTIATLSSSDCGSVPALSDFHLVLVFAALIALGSILVPRRISAGG